MFVVVVVWFCRSSSLAFLISAYLINLMHHFLLHWVICYLFVHTPNFLKNTWIFVFFYLFLIWKTIMPKLWMSGVATLCAIAHYQASLFTSVFSERTEKWEALIKCIYYYIGHFSKTSWPFCFRSITIFFPCYKRYELTWLNF